MEILNETFANNLNYYMEIRKKSQADLAKALGVATSTVSYWCKGMKIPRADKVAAICRFLMIDMNDLLTDKSDVPNFEQYMWDNYGVMMRKFGELSEEDKKIVVDLVERLRNSGE